MSKVEIIDRQGKSYYVTADQAKASVDSGVYRYADMPQFQAKKKNTAAPLGATVSIYHKTTGQKITRAMIDAEELVKHGFYAYDPPSGMGQEEKTAPGASEDAENEKEDAAPADETEEPDDDEDIVIKRKPAAKKTAKK